MHDWSSEASLLTARGTLLSPGLSPTELHDLEQRLQLSFPPDLAEFLSAAVPVGDRWPLWRGHSVALAEALSWPTQGLLFDVEHNGFWWPSWGGRPVELSEALAQAEDELRKVPRLIPVYSHRYLPANPAKAGNPVFSVYQSDVIYYGSDLGDYFRREFDVGAATADPRTPRRIRFWSDLVDANNERASSGAV